MHKLLFRAAFTFYFLFSFVYSFSQTETTPKKEMTAVRTIATIQIDGKLDEEIWSSASPATDFIQFQFKHNIPSAYRTEIKIMYDNNALYVGAYMYDPYPDSIMQELSTRDNLGSADFFDVIIDTYNEGINALEFIVSASGVQLDAKMYPSNNGDEDFNWDAVWQSATKINADGWCAEIKIPYSAIRFPNEMSQTWGINFVREVKRNRDKSSWNKIDPEIQGFVNQSGILNGIENIEAPVRLSISPYFSAYYDIYSDNANDITSTGTSFNGGADLKYGLNDAFTLDMTLIPDFGQVQSDNQILNLTPFETYFVEQRQFFTEGTELFNKGNLFYSRRVGGTPIGFYNVVYGSDSVVSNPQQTRLLNATKISGRTTKGTGLGFFNAIEGETYAETIDSEGNKNKILTGPATNYNVVVVDQSLKNNSDIYLINTNVMRSGKFYDANTTGGGFALNNKGNIWRVSGGGAVTQKYFDCGDSIELGYAHHVSAGKVGGKFQYGVGYWYEGDTYNPNDLGYLQNNNTVSYNVNGSYHKYDPFWHFNQLNVFSELNYSRIINPDEFFNLDTYTEAWGSFRNNMFAGLWVATEPVITYDWFEPRVFGRYYTY
ncbi:MAG: carbohydrate binding family 9 domain-containing protein, partial [Fimbriimonadaceae bacterium]|nr:carbohydrate binding family 9 domain-containing protein [Chitinophagales bacterium]